MIQNIFRCPHCGKETIQVTLASCFIEDDDNAILDFRCSNCSWEHHIGNFEPVVYPTIPMAYNAQGLN